MDYKLAMQSHNRTEGRVTNKNQRLLEQVCN